MATGYSPRIVTDGLVLALDAGNNKSFRGEPTTNVVANPIPTTSWTVSNFGGSSASREFLTENGIPFMRISNVTNASDYPRLTDSVFPNSATITGTFSTSLEARGTPGAQIRLRIYENGSTKITNTVTLTNEWVRYKFENQSTGFALNQPYFNPVTTGATYDIRNIQIEAKAYATPFVNGTRGTTVATGGGWKNIATTTYNASLDNGTSYTSTGLGGLLFDGVNDRATLSPAINLNNTSYSVDGWVKRNTTGAVHGIISDLQYDWWTFSITSGNKLRIHHRRETDNVTNSLTSQANISTNLTHVGVVFDINNGMRLYVNGYLDSSNSNIVPALLLTTGRGPQFIGQFRPDAPGDVGVMNGSIASLRIYTRALTASEILQNYNATKGRFGL